MASQDPSQERSLLRELAGELRPDRLLLALTGGLVVGVVTAKVNTPRTFQLTGRLVRDAAIAIRSETVFGFLATHDQPHLRTGPAVPLGDAEILDHARGFVARVVCWK